MTLTELIAMTRLFARDLNGYVFTDIICTLYINQAIDRIKQYIVFDGMTHLSTGTDVPLLLPESYHYIIALFAASRCLDMDERFYEGTEKRNEFEDMLDELIAEIQSGNLVIVDALNATVEDTTTFVDYVTDTYFNDSTADDDGVDSI